MSTAVHLGNALRSLPATLSRPALAALFAWLGAIKIVPALNPGAAGAEEFAQILTGGKVEPSIVLIAIGVLQVAAAIALLIPRLRNVAAALFLLQIVIAVVAASVGYRALLSDGSALNGTGLALVKTTVLALCALGLTAAPPVRSV